MWIQQWATCSSSLNLPMRSWHIQTYCSSNYGVRAESSKVNNQIFKPRPICGDQKLTEATSHYCIKQVDSGDCPRNHQHHNDANDQEQAGSQGCTVLIAVELSCRDSDCHQLQLLELSLVAGMHAKIPPPLGHHPHHQRCHACIHTTM